MILTPDNYHSDEANIAYMSCSQWKQAMACPARWHAIYVAHTYQQPSRKAMDTGSLLHAACLEPDTVADVMVECAESLCTKAGKPTADSSKILAVAAWLKERDEISHLWGEGARVEQIVTFKLGGMAWKAKLDIIRDEERRILDIKKTRGLHHTEWSSEYGKRVPWFLFYGYDLQMALYQEALYQQTEETYSVSLIPVVLPTESVPTPDAAVMEWDDPACGQDGIPVAGSFGHLLNEVTRNVAMVQGWRESDGFGLRRCGHDDCDYCRRTKTEYGMTIGPVERVEL